MIIGLVMLYVIVMLGCGLVSISFSDMDRDECFAWSILWPIAFTLSLVKGTKKLFRKASL